jgi:hypothetical protein
VTWQLVLLHDGQPVCDPVPADDWQVADVGAEILSRLFGGPVSVGVAVVQHQRSLVVSDRLWEDVA